LAKDNPHFRDWRAFALPGFGHLELVKDIRRLISTPETPFGLYLLMLEALKGNEIASALIEDLRRIVLDPQAFFCGQESSR